MSTCLINYIKIFSRKTGGPCPCTATTNNMEQNKDDWNKLMESLELDDLQNKVNNIADKFDFKITEEKSETRKYEKKERKQEKSDCPITPDYSNKLRDYLNIEDYTPLKKCENCEEMYQYKKHICNHVTYDLEIFTRQEDLIDQPEQQTEQQPEQKHQEDEYQDLFKQIESLDFSQNETNYPTSEPLDQTPSIENDIEIIDLESIIQNEILEILDPIEVEGEEDIIEVEVPNEEAIVEDSTEDFDSPTNQYNPVIEEIEEVLTRQETKDERRLREFQKINRYFLRKLRENPNFEVENFREVVYSENGELKYQAIYGPPIPTSQMIRQLFEKNKDEFRIMNQDLEFFLRKFSHRVFKFFKKFPQIKEPFEYSRIDEITKTRKNHICCISQHLQ